MGDNWVCHFGLSPSSCHQGVFASSHLPFFWNPTSFWKSPLNLRGMKLSLHLYLNLFYCKVYFVNFLGGFSSLSHLQPLTESSEDPSEGSCLSLPGVSLMLACVPAWKVSGTAAWDEMFISNLQGLEEWSFIQNKTKTPLPPLPPSSTAASLEAFSLVHSLLASMWVPCVRCWINIFNTPVHLLS